MVPMLYAFDSADKITPPLSPLRVQIEPPEKRRRRERSPKKPQKNEEEEGKDKGNSDRGKAVDVLV
jgi:hypothetical protein